MTLPQRIRAAWRYFRSMGYVHPQKVIRTKEETTAKLREELGRVRRA